VDQDGDVLDSLVQYQRDKKAAKKFFRKLLKGLCYVPRAIISAIIERQALTMDVTFPDPSIYPLSG
jgi:transposase-like protein